MMDFPHQERVRKRQLSINAVVSQGQSCIRQGNGNDAAIAKVVGRKRGQILPEECWVWMTACQPNDVN